MDLLSGGIILMYKKQQQDFLNRRRFRSILFFFIRPAVFSASEDVVVQPLALNTTKVSRGDEKSQVIFIINNSRRLM